MGHIRRAITGCAFFAGAVFSTASAAQQIDLATHEAEQLRKLDIMLMVMELHCRNTPDAFAEEYDAFATTHRRTMRDASQQLRSSHARGMSARAQARRLDTISTVMANEYGAGHPWMRCVDIREATSALGQTNSRLELLLAADELLSAEPPIRVAMDAAVRDD